MRWVIAPVRRLNQPAPVGGSYTSMFQAHRSHHGTAPRSLTNAAPHVGQAPAVDKVTANILAPAPDPPLPARRAHAWITIGRPR